MTSPSFLSTPLPPKAMDSIFPLIIRPLVNLRLRQFWGLFWPIFDSFCGGGIPKVFEKLAQKNTQMDRSLIMQEVLTPFVLYRYILPYDPPFPEREGLLLRIFHPEGEGWGEIAPLPGRSRETLSQALAQLLYVLTEEKSIPLFPSVAFGLFSARQHTQSLKSPLPLSALLAGTPEQIIAKAEKASSQGFTSVKIKITDIPTTLAAELIQHVSRLFYSIRIDANRAYSFQEAMHLCEECGMHRVEYIEEPTYELEQL